ncbi:unnamed protein product [Trichogramma brassicae]|uniref:Uncharacterized protein n=1 Tax=Trichogramma brassicae TaxID=86971 RepID=A0A6H5I518_9HYME|nr:unnamed protein product [Trichogramma brassicae]
MQRKARASQQRVAAVPEAAAAAAAARQISEGEFRCAAPCSSSTERVRKLHERGAAAAVAATTTAVVIAAGGISITVCRFFCFPPCDSLIRNKKSLDRAGAKSPGGKKQQQLRGRSSTVINRINSAAGLVPAEALASCSDSWSRRYSGSSSSSSSIKASYVPRRGSSPCIYDTYIDPLRCRRRRRLLYILPIQRVSETIWLLRLPIYMCASLLALRRGFAVRQPKSQSCPPLSVREERRLTLSNSRADKELLLLIVHDSPRLQTFVLRRPASAPIGDCFLIISRSRASSSRPRSDDIALFWAGHSTESCLLRAHPHTHTQKWPLYSIAQHAQVYTVMTAAAAFNSARVNLDLIRRACALTLYIIQLRALSYKRIAIRVYTYVRAQFQLSFSSSSSSRPRVNGILERSSDEREILAISARIKRESEKRRRRGEIATIRTDDYEYINSKSCVYTTALIVSSRRGAPADPSTMLVATLLSYIRTICKRILSDSSIFDIIQLRDKDLEYS